MRTHDAKLNNAEHSPAPAIKRESSQGGTAIFSDHRPSSTHQRKLMEAIQTKSGNVKSLQQKKAKGTTRFQQIASAMGKQYGVDTSGLHATHSSSFPAKLHAEATIQGNKIHFAPGRDTDYNIRHEVAHAIDNTLNGTPKGDRSVNGFKVDVSRENTVDQMAKTTTNSEKNDSLQNQGKFVGTGQIVQRRETDQIEEIEDLSFSTLIDYQKNFQVQVKRNPEAYKEEFTTVGFEHEFAQMKDESGRPSPMLKGISHLELTKSTSPIMPITGLPFILETDANTALELVSPPFLLQTEKGRPLPKQQVVDKVDKIMSEELKLLAQQAMDLGDLVARFQGLGIRFEALSKPRITAAHISHNTDPFSIQGFKNGIFPVRDIEKIPVAESDKYGSHKFSQTNVATDLEAAFFMETNLDFKETRQYTVMQKYIVLQAIEALRQIDDSSIDRSMVFFLNQLAQVFLTQMAVWPLEQLRTYQGTRFQVPKVIDEDEKNQFGIMASATSGIKEFNGVWMKDSLMNMGLGVLSPVQWQAVDTLLNHLRFQDTIKNVGNINPTRNDGWLAMLVGYFQMKTPAAIVNFQKNFRKNLQQAIKTLQKEVKMICALKNGSKPPVQAPPRVNLYEHNSDHHIRARQDTMLNAKLVNNSLMKILWPGRFLHVLEIRGNADEDVFNKANNRLNDSMEPKVEENVGFDHFEDAESPRITKQIQLGMDFNEAINIYESKIKKYLERFTPKQDNLDHLDWQFDYHQDYDDLPFHEYPEVVSRYVDTYPPRLVLDHLKECFDSEQNHFTHTLMEDYTRGIPLSELVLAILIAANSNGHNIKKGSRLHKGLVEAIGKVKETRYAQVIQDSGENQDGEIRRVKNAMRKKKEPGRVNRARGIQKPGSDY